MEAAVLYGPRDLRVEDVDTPVPPRGWALIESKAVGICGTDKAFYTGSYKLLKAPLIPGHEVSGVVVEGPEDLVGESVVSEINFSCMSCEVCRLGLYTHCPRKATLGIDFDGAMAEYFAAPSWALHKHRLAHDMAFAAEPLAAVLNAFTQQPLKPGELVVVLGTGLIGILSAQVARLLGAEVYIVARPGSRKAGHARALGLEVVSYEEALEISRLRGLGGLGFDVVVEATGTNEGLRKAVELVRPRGVIHLKSTPGGEALLPQTVAVVKEARIIGTRCGSSREFRAALELLDRGEVRIPAVEKYPLERAREAFDRALQGDVVRVVVEP